MRKAAPSHRRGTCRADQSIVKEHMDDKLNAIIEDEEEDAIANKKADARSASTNAEAKLEEEISSQFNETEKIMAPLPTTDGDAHVETFIDPLETPVPGGEAYTIEAFTSDSSLVDNGSLTVKDIGPCRSTPTTPSSTESEMSDASMSPAKSSVIGSVDSDSSPEVNSDMPLRRAVELKSLARSGRSLTGKLESVKMDEEMPDVTEPILTNSPPPSLDGSENSTPALDAESESSSVHGDDDDYEPGASQTWSAVDKDDDDDDDDDDDEASSESDKGKGTVHRAALHRPSGARAVLRAKDDNGNDLSEHNCMALVGKHVLVKRTMSKAMQHGEVSSVEVSKSTTPPAIYLKVELDNGSVEWLTVGGPGRLHDLNWPAKQLPFVHPERSGLREAVRKWGVGPPPHKKVDVDEMTPICILLDAPRSMAANTNFRNGLGSREYAWFPVLQASGCGEPVVSVGDIITYQTVNGTTKELNAPAEIYVIMAIGTILEVNPNPNPTP